MADLTQAVAESHRLAPHQTGASKRSIRAAGGPGSGNFGHAGRPGQVGGSAPRRGGRLVGIHSQLYGEGVGTRVFGEGKQDAIFELGRSLIKELPEGSYVMSVATTGNSLAETLTKIGREGDAAVQIRIHSTTKNEKGAYNTDIERVFYRNAEGKLEVEHFIFVLPEAAQGRGIGKDIMSRQLEFYDKIGVSTIKTKANVDVGGYAWAKYGFKLDDPEFEPNVAHDFNFTLKNIVEAHRRSDGSLDPKVVWAVADNSYGKRALIGKEWRGRLDLDDTEAMQRVRKYVEKPSRLRAAIETEKDANGDGGESSASLASDRGNEFCVRYSDGRYSDAELWSELLNEEF